MHPYFSLQGRTALVTGGTRGIGKMIAKAFLEAGATVYVCARDGEACAQTAAELSAFGTCHGIAANLASEEGVQALAAQQLFERLLRIKASIEARAGFAGDAGGVVRQADAGLAGELVQCRGQGAGGDVPVAGLGVAGRRFGPCEQRRGCAVQAGAEQGCVHRVLEGGTLGGERLHDRGMLLKEVDRTGLLIGLSLQVERQ